MSSIYIFTWFQSYDPFLKTKVTQLSIDAGDLEISTTNLTTAPKYFSWQEFTHDIWTTETLN